MKRALSVLAALAALLIGKTAGAQEEGRFDAQAFRPAAAPRDLVMVQKSEVIGSFSPVVGLYYDFSLNPLELLNNDTGKTVQAVAARLQLTGLAGIGFFDWLDLTLAVPFVAWQSSENLRQFGTEGEVRTPAFGDLRLSSKVALPFLNRKDEVKAGFGMAVVGNVNLPTGDQDAFAGEGALSGGTMLVADYRFNFGLLVALNGGVYLRPDHQFAGVHVGDTGQFGVAGEMYVVQRWGVSVIGELYGYPQLTSFPDSPKQVPMEALLGIRWQTKQGITITFGGSFGAACGFGSPAIRFFNGIVWTPKTSQEQEEINRLMQRDSDDPDHDGLIEQADKCPDMPGSPVNFGCPDMDRDEDGWVDRDDECPEIAAGPRGKKGCPVVYIRGDEIVILDQVHFATDRDVILDDSKPILEEVALVLINHPEIREVRIEGHTDVRAGDAYNMNLSQRRVDSVMAYLVSRGIDPARLNAKGYGHSQPIYDDSTCVGSDDSLSEDCRRMTAKNRRVVFRILRYGAPPPRPITGADSSSSVLPSRGSILPKGGALPSEGVLKSDGALGGTRVLPSAGDGSSGAGLPGRQGILPGQGSVLPRSGAPAPAPSPAPPPAPTPPKK